VTDWYDNSNSIGKVAKLNDAGSSSDTSRFTKYENENIYEFVKFLAKNLDN
jgi:hypothetical protein